LTLGQLEVLYDDCQKRLYSHLRFLAALQGVDLDKETREKEEEQLTLFKDPKEYTHLSPEEATQLTQEMLKRHRKKLGE